MFEVGRVRASARPEPRTPIATSRRQVLRWVFEDEEEDEDEEETFREPETVNRKPKTVNLRPRAAAGGGGGNRTRE
jgi:hypothetical protein